MKDRNDKIQETMLHYNHLSDKYNTYANRRSYYLNSLDNIIIDHVHKLHPCTYIDIGCGTGRILKKLHTRFPESKGYGIDLSHKMVEKCTQAGLTVDHCDFIDYIPTTSIDLLILEFNVFGYLITQNGLVPTLDHIHNLVDNKGTIIFDILNPYCITYSSVFKTFPTAIKRWFQMKKGHGIINFQYSLNHDNIEMGVVKSDLITSYFQSAGYSTNIIMIKYTNHRFFKYLPRLLNSHILFIIQAE